MKNLSIYCAWSLIFLFFVSPSSAQVPKSELKNVIITPSLSFPKASLLYETDKGYIYSLPQDGMICFVPKMDSTHIPGNLILPPDLANIPNPLYKKLPHNLITTPRIKGSPGVRYLYERK